MKFQGFDELHCSSVYDGNPLFIGIQTSESLDTISVIITGKLSNGITVLACRINNVNGSSGAGLIQFHQYTNSNTNGLRGDKH